MVKLHELDQYDDAEVVRKKTAALIAGFITKPSPEYGDEEGADPDENGALSVNWSPGTMQILEPGEDVKFSEPADVGGQYQVFMQLQLRSVAVAIGVTYEQLTGDLSGVNYSSIRAGLVEIRRRFRQLQNMLIIHQFCFPIWERWMDAAVLCGKLEAPDYVRRQSDYLAVQWIPQGFAWVDPLKDIQAAVMMIRAGIMSRDQVIAEFGFTGEDVDKALSEEQERADGFGLVLDSDPRSRTKTGNSVKES